MTSEEKCKCGHSFGSHGRGHARDLIKNGSYWGCYSAGCDCRIFETVDQWASALARKAQEAGRLDADDEAFMAWWSVFGRSLFRAWQEVGGEKADG